MLTEGHMDNYVFQQWTIACHCYQKHSGLEPRFVAWYHVNQLRIDSMTLDQYLQELQKFALPCCWQSRVRDTILESYQENMLFADWVVVLQNLNARLENTNSEHALSQTSLKAHLESHMRPDLQRKVDYTKIPDGELADWITEVTELDKELAEERAQTQVLIDANNAERAGKWKPLAERISEPPSRTPSSLTPGMTMLQIKLAKLIDDEKRLLTEQKECTRCRTFYCNHPGNPGACPMKISNSWPDPKTTKMLTLAMALAAKPKAVAGLAYAETARNEEIGDKDTDDSYMYANTSSSMLSAPHMTVMMEVMGLATHSSPLSVCAILDNSCPSTVISDEFATKLGLQRFRLPKSEDNLISLTEDPLTCNEYVRLEATVGNGAWKSGVFQAKVNVRLPVPLVLGIPFLSAEKLVLDIGDNTAVDKGTGFDIVNLKHTLTPTSPIPPTQTHMRAKMSDSARRQKCVTPPSP
ncbi:hypothetical protein C0993_008363 [Termitomyces sp. T159_Od127]|nr:hypothetical protein C0993_008363 [Termitomyces sp. T159_Od127]